LTYPLIGNYGIPGRELENGLLKNFESEKIQVQGLIISDYSENYSHWDAQQSLHDWMVSEKIPGLYCVDTRKLTQKLRVKGSMLGKIVSSTEDDLHFEDPNLRLLAKEASSTKKMVYQKGEKKIALVDCGVKNNIIQAFLKRDITVIRLPYGEDFLEEKPDGILLSNGPGDPKLCNELIEQTKKAIEKEIPILGICLGSQILALAAGAETYKLKFGHRSHNQPVNEVGTKRCYITSQNHGYAIDAKTLPEDWREWFANDNDSTNEGIMHIYKPFFGAQFHPEASPGPDDTEFIFDLFVRTMR
jgi:carbamoyl-phosphate synthase small subunit